jgi:hypothetical protein
MHGIGMNDPKIHGIHGHLLFGGKVVGGCLIKKGNLQDKIAGDAQSFVHWLV